MPLDPTVLEQLATSLNQYVDTGSIPGYVALLNVGEETWVHHHGVQDLETGSPMRPDSLFRIASMTKAVLGAATMMLVEDGRLDLDDTVERWLPELANRSVVRSITGPLDDTVPATRPITTRDLLTLTWGLGALMTEPGDSPLADAMEALGVGPGPYQPDLSPDAFMAAIGSLPLAHQPGEGWLYHTGYDVLPILLERVTGVPTESFLHERLFEPLGMSDTGFTVPATSLGRFTTAYAKEGDTLAVVDPAMGGRWTRSPGVPTGLVSTAPDYLAFGKLLLAEGMTPTGRLLSAASIHEITRDHIPGPVKIDYPFYPGFWSNTGWGYGVGITLDDLASSTPAPGGSYGWSGGLNTHWQNQPRNTLVGLLFTQRFVTGLDDEAMISEFWRLTADATSPL